MNDKAPSLSQIGAALGVVKSRVHALKVEGMPVDSVEAAQAWYQARVRATAKSASKAVAPPSRPPAPDPDNRGTPDFYEERARKERGLADKAEMEAAKMRGDLIEVVAVRAEFAKQASAVRDGLLNIPARLAPLLAAESSVRKVQTLLDTELRAVLAQFVGEAV